MISDSSTGDDILPKEGCEDQQDYWQGRTEARFLSPISLDHFQWFLECKTQNFILHTLTFSAAYASAGITVIISGDLNTCAPKPLHQTLDATFI
ncbi:hypothetical protein L6452_13403 [Arctium lappa]|uniref:Uncharacterized protein n=1 Tax=Arctium lappa TaxID=4217 RepID=A0ACB9CI35_ARCLA|nr:hypothetical protein L6452_13403 [Arctium lappa]